MVHFYHEAERSSPKVIADVASEQLRAWLELHKILTEHWKPAFANYTGEISGIENRLRKHREYPKVRFD
jgi:hypothetical protein